MKKPSVSTAFFLTIALFFRSLIDRQLVSVMINAVYFAGVSEVIVEVHALLHGFSSLIGRVDRCPVKDPVCSIGIILDGQPDIFGECHFIDYIFAAVFPEVCNSRLTNQAVEVVKVVDGAVTEVGCKTINISGYQGRNGFF
jgi:hypothetical protein